MGYRYFFSLHDGQGHLRDQVQYFVSFSLNGIVLSLTLVQKRENINTELTLIFLVLTRIGTARSEGHLRGGGGETSQCHITKI